MPSTVFKIDMAATPVIARSPLPDTKTRRGGLVRALAPTAIYRGLVAAVSLSSDQTGGTVALGTTSNAQA